MEIHAFLNALHCKTIDYEKKRIKFLIAGLLMVLVGCTDRGSVDTIDYKMVNNSGHKVAITLDDFNKKFPAELILQDGESYQWQNPNGKGYMDNVFEPFTPEGGGDIKVEYDDNYVVIFVFRGDNPRNPRWRENYVKQNIGKHRYLYTYTFTEEDYDSAVNQ